MKISKRSRKGPGGSTMPGDKRESINARGRFSKEARADRRKTRVARKKFADAPKSKPYPPINKKP